MATNPNEILPRRPTTSETTLRDNVSLESPKLVEIPISTSDPETLILCNPLRRRLIEEEDMDPELATEIANSNMSPREIQKAITLNRLKRRITPNNPEVTTQKSSGNQRWKKQIQEDPSFTNSPNLSQRSLNRRKLLQAAGGFTLAALGGSVLGALAKPFSEDMHSSISHTDSIQRRVRKRDILHLSADATEIVTPINTIVHHGWSNKMGLTKPLLYSESFPDRKLSWTFTTNDEEIGKITLQDSKLDTRGNVENDLTQKGERSLQVNIFPTQEKEILIVNFREESDSLVLEEQEVTVPIIAYIPAPEDPSDQPRVFCELDVNSLHPEKQILQRASIILTQFEDLLPDLKITLFDASDLYALGAYPDKFYDSKHQVIKLPVQYWINPSYAQQEELTLFRLLSYAVVTNTHRNAVDQTIAAGQLEKTIHTIENNDRKAILQTFNKLKDTTGYAPPLQEIRTSEPTFLAYYPPRYNQNLRNEIIFGLIDNVPKYRRLLTDALTIFAYYQTQFIYQFFINDPSSPLYLSPSQQERTLELGRQIFGYLNTITTSSKSWEKIIPRFGALRDFVFNHQINTT